MKLDNGILRLEVENKGGEMTSLIFNGVNVLYDGKGEYWSGKNPTLFPIISSPNSKQYILDGKLYPIKNHGLIRYATLDTLVDDGKKIILGLKANEETLKQYPFNFDFKMGYKLVNNKVVISYNIKNNDNKIMPFTFGIHPGFVADLNNDYVDFNQDEYCEMLTSQKIKESIKKKLGKYSLKEFCKDIDAYQTVIFKPLKTKIYELVRNDYKIRIDGSQFKYLAMWTPDKKSNFLCIEPWCSVNYIKECNNPFDRNFELFYLQPNEEFNISYSIELIKIIKKKDKKAKVILSLVFCLMLICAIGYIIYRALH